MGLALLGNENSDQREELGCRWLLDRYTRHE
jgi:hypothetical protein